MKLKVIILEAYPSEVDDVQKKISKLTDYNNHFGAALELAKFTNEKKYELFLTHLSKAANVLQHTPVQLIQLRTDIVNTLLDKIKSKYGKQAFVKLKAAF